LRIQAVQYLLPREPFRIVEKVGVEILLVRAGRSVEAVDADPRELVAHLLRGRAHQQHRKEGRGHAADYGGRRGPGHLGKHVRKQEAELLQVLRRLAGIEKEPSLAAANWRRPCSVDVPEEAGPRILPGLLLSAERHVCQPHCIGETMAGDRLV